MTIGVAVLGSTGSIGCSALAVLERHPEDFSLVSLAAYRNATALREQVARYRPARAILVDSEDLDQTLLPESGAWRFGRGELLAAAADPDVGIVINAVVGAAGLEASLAALRAGKRLALANKESLVVGGSLLLEAMAEGGGELVPIDSEHSAILQCLAAGTGFAPRPDPPRAVFCVAETVRRLILTASGGPFREWDPDALSRVTPGQALRHPTWAMGEKISIDSASLVNKALEVVEAHFLFGLPYDAIDVMLHPQSIVHSMVEFIDGSVLAQMGDPDMELPILYALGYPSRLEERSRSFDLVGASPLSFHELDPERFPAFRLGIEAGRCGGTAPALFNAANEVAVSAFLAEEISFPGIATVIESVLAAVDAVPVDSLQTVLDADRRARAVARESVLARC